jgi:hypothetical protein
MERQMSDENRQVSKTAEAEEKAAPKGAAANSGQSSGSNAAGTGNNPQDGGDSGGADEARPRGRTEDPDITL